MVRRLIEQRPALDAYFISHRQDLLLVDGDWKILKDVHDLLLPFTEFSKALCRDSSSLAMQVTAAKVLEAELAVNTQPHLKVEVDKMKTLVDEKFGGVWLYKYENTLYGYDYAKYF